MKKFKLISDFSRYILLAFGLVDMIWYGKTHLSFFSSKFLFFGTIATWLIYVVSYVGYLIQAKNYKELKQFFLSLIIAIAVICLLIFVDYKIM